MAAAVPGMNWAIPSAPAGDTMPGSKLDSCASCAASRIADTLQRCDAATMSATYAGGTNDGSVDETRPSALAGRRSTGLSV